MNRLSRAVLPLSAVLIVAAGAPAVAQDRLERIKYNNPGLVVDLGVGLWAWPLPMDYDGDGDLDLVVSCPDKPYNGTYFFENPGAGEQRGESREQRGEESGVRSQESGKSGRSEVGGRRSLNHQPSTINPQLVFKPAVRIADAMPNVQLSWVNGEPVVMAPQRIFRDFRRTQYANPEKLPLPAVVDPQYKRIRANQWKLVDYDGDGDHDLIIGHEFWDDYGWDDAWDENGNWKNGPLHGFVYVARNEGTDAEPKYADPVKVTTADGKPVDVYGMPSPNFADFDGDGDLDLICGEFLDGFTYFENVGTRAAPRYATGLRLWCRQSSIALIEPLRMDLQMITPSAVDWDGDDDIDLICGDEDGRVALIENVGAADRGRIEAANLDRLDDYRLDAPPERWVPLFTRPTYLSQEAIEVKFGALVTPVGVDWDGDGDEDLVCGNTAGYVGVIHNLGDFPPRWSSPSLALVETQFSNHAGLVEDIRHRAGPNGSIQGPCEANWGYTTLSVADWDHDGLVDLIVNDIRGKAVWYRNDGARVKPRFSHNHPVHVDHSGPPPKPDWMWWTPKDNELVTQWRTTPVVVDWNDDGLNDLVMLDPEGYLAFYERARDKGQGTKDKAAALDAQPSSLDAHPLLPPQRLFCIEGPCEFDQRHRPVGDKRDGLLRLNANRAGASGRRKLCIVDWDGDGRRDLLVNSVNVNFLRNVRTDDEGRTWFRDEGPLDDRVLAGHDTSPTTVDWDKNGIPDLLVGAEDGHLYYKRNPRAARD